MSNPLLEIQYFKQLKNSNAFKNFVEKEKTKWSVFLLAILFAFVFLSFLTISYLNYSFIIMPDSTETSEFFGFSFSLASIGRLMISIVSTILPIFLADQFFKWVYEKRTNQFKEKYNITLSMFEKKQHKWNKYFNWLSIVLLIFSLYSHYVIAITARNSWSSIAENTSQNPNFLFGILSVFLPVFLGYLVYEISKNYLLITSYRMTKRHRQRIQNHRKEIYLSAKKDKEIHISFKKIMIFKQHLEIKNLKINTESKLYIIQDFNYLKSFETFRDYIYNQLNTKYFINSNSNTA